MRNYLSESYIINEINRNWHEADIEIFPGETVKAMTWNNFKITSSPEDGGFDIYYKNIAVFKCFSDLLSVQLAAECIDCLLVLKQTLESDLWIDMELACQNDFHSTIITLINALKISWKLRESYKAPNNVTSARRCFSSSK